MMKRFEICRCVLLCVVLNLSNTLHAQKTDGDLIEMPRQGVRIPVDVFENIVYVPVFVEGKGPFLFILDTGAGFSSFVDEETAKRLNLNLDDSILLGGAGNSQVMSSRLNAARFNISEFLFPMAAVRTLPFRLLNPHWGRRIEGLLGGDLFGSIAFSIDYENSLLTFSPSAESTSTLKSGHRVPLTIEQGFIMVDVVVHPYNEAPIKTRMMVDTGLRITTFYMPFSRAHQLRKQSPKTLDAMTGRGIGGETKGIIGRVKAIEIGDLFIHEPVVSFAQDTAGALASTLDGGILGADILSRFQISFDYPNQRMVLSETPKGRNPYEYDMLGIWFRCEGSDFNQFTVHYIIPGSPAEQAGIQVGDRLVSINGESTSLFDLERLRAGFRRDGEPLKLELERQNQIITIQVRLKRMV